MVAVLEGFEQFYSNQLLSRTEVSSEVMPATRIETWIVIRAVKQADESYDK